VTMSEKKTKLTVIGLTGSYGTGKTAVAGMFKRLGAVILDADRLAHKAYRKGSYSYRKIVKAFGPDVPERSGDLDRSKLAQIVFSNKVSLNRLCKIVHPVVVRDIKRSIKRISASSAKRVVIIDAPLLIEAGLQDIADYLIVVKTSRPTQLKRLIKKTGYSRQDIVKRICSQIPLSKKIRLADFIIDNEGSIKRTDKTVKKIWREIKKR